MDEIRDVVADGGYTGDGDGGKKMEKKEAKIRGRQLQRGI